MKFEVIKPLKLKTVLGEKIYRPGDVFEAIPEKVTAVIDQGLARPAKSIYPCEICKKEFFVKDGDDSSRLIRHSCLSLDGLKSRNIAFRIQSEVLGEDVWLVSNDSTKERLKSEGLVVYAVDEFLRGVAFAGEDDQF